MWIKAENGGEGHTVEFPEGHCEAFSLKSMGDRKTLRFTCSLHLLSNAVCPSAWPCDTVCVLYYQVRPSLYLQLCLSGRNLRSTIPVSLTHAKGSRDEWFSKCNCVFT